MWEGTAVIPGAELPTKGEAGHHGEILVHERGNQVMRPETIFLERPAG